MGSMVLSILLWALVAAFALDFWIRMGRLERGIVLLAVLGVIVWTVIRYLLPALKIHESDTTLAVMVDKRHGLHSDLVAAIQFDDEGRPQYGSTDLREAVIEHTGRAASDVNFLSGFSPKELALRLLMFLITAAVCLPPAAYYSGHTSAFLNRLLLGKARYPTQIIIEKIVSPGARVPYSHPVEFKVRVGLRPGADIEMPKSGRVRIEALTTGLETTVDLNPDEKDPSLYTGTLNRVLDDLSYVIYVGDAESDPQSLSLIHLPLAELSMKVIAPEYARGKVRAQPKSQRQVVVLEGSQVIPMVTANKELKSCTLIIEGILMQAKRRAVELSEQQEEFSDTARAQKLTDENTKQWVTQQEQVTNGLNGLISLLEGNEPYTGLTRTAASASEAARKAFFAQVKPRALDQQGQVIDALEKLLEKLRQQIELDTIKLVVRRDKSFVSDSKTRQAPELAKVTEMVRFQIQVKDADGLGLENPIKGTVHVSADMPPRVALAAWSRFVVPKATPGLWYRAVDDYALHSLVLHLSVVRADGEETPLAPIPPFEVPEHKDRHDGSYVLRLADLKAKDGKPIKLQKGQQIVAIMEAVDYRGEPGKSRSSEKWVFEVTDQAGVLGAMDRLDEEMDKKLDDILRAQLEAGR